MKTYKKNLAVPRLVIEYDMDSESPRVNDTIGVFLTKESRHKSPDGNMHALYNIMIETEEEAENTEHHIKLMEERAHKAFKDSAPKDGNSHDEDLHVIEIHPIYRYEHGNVVYKRGTTNGFDYSNCGFYFVTAQSISGSIWDAERIAKAIDRELEEYTHWCNGEIYCFTLYNNNGEIEDFGGDYYKIDDIRGSLPDEWKKENLEEYLV